MTNLCNTFCIIRLLELSQNKIIRISQLFPLITYKIGHFMFETKKTSNVIGLAKYVTLLWHLITYTHVKWFTSALINVWINFFEYNFSLTFLILMFSFLTFFFVLLSFHSVFECIECFQPIIENRDEAQRIYGLDGYKLTDFSETWTRIAHQINIDSNAVCMIWVKWNVHVHEHKQVCYSL